jgi:hypothetical protein
MISIRGVNDGTARDIVDVESTRSERENVEIDLVLSLVIPPHRGTVSDE